MVLFTALWNSGGSILFRRHLRISRWRPEVRAMDSSEEGYRPEPDFEEDTKDLLLDISMTDSKELWLIQWPLNQLQPADLHGKELKLKLHRDGQLGSFESSSGKSYNLVSYAAQELDATVFMASAESKVVGKISRRVCLVHYPEPGELERPSFNNPNLSSLRSGGSLRKSMSHLTSTHSIAQRSIESSRHSRKRKHENSRSQPGPSGKSLGHSGASGPESQISHVSLGSEQSHGEKSKKKRKIKLEE